jgi:hypothetical protein
MVETALSIAREKAARRGITADFGVADALHLGRLGRVLSLTRPDGALCNSHRAKRHSASPAADLRRQAKAAASGQVARSAPAPSVAVMSPAALAFSTSALTVMNPMPRRRATSTRMPMPTST